MTGFTVVLRLLFQSRSVPCLCWRERTLPVFHSIEDDRMADMFIGSGACQVSPYLDNASMTHLPMFSTESPIHGQS
jgi:hypothetical protein